MCGITLYHGNPNANPIEAMTRILSHRGPDKQSVYIGTQASLGSARLSINDLSNGSMPMFNEDKTLVVVHNGEIYNAPSLRQELQKRGHIFSSTSDTEVLVHGFEEYGQDLVRHVQGIFAFIVYDSKTENVFAARDSMGVKPLYFYHDGSDLFLASEVKSILQSGRIRPRINYDFLAERYVFGHPVSFSSIIEGVNQVPPGHILKYDGKSNPTLDRYYSGAFPRDKKDLSQVVNEAMRLLPETIDKQLLADVPVGLLLSGGIDSCGLTFLLARIQNQRFQTFSISDDANHEEIVYARRMAKHAKTEHNEIIALHQEGVEALPKYLWALEDIDYNHMMLYLLGHHMKGKVKSVLSGHGADELFLGYGMYRQVAEYSASIQRRLENLHRHHPELVSFKLNEVFVEYFKDPDIHRMIRFNQDIELPNDNLNLVDRLFMAHGIEVRVPYLDRDVVAFANSLPVGYCLSEDQDKIVLRGALAKLGLPHEFVDRPKRMAGRKTIPHIISAIEEFADGVVSDSYIKSHPFGTLLDYDDLMLVFEGSHTNNRRRKLKSHVLAFELIKHIFIDHKGKEPGIIKLQELFG